MNNRIPFSTKCSLHPWITETFSVDYIYHDNQWIHSPINICDNSNNSKTCIECVTNIYNRAKEAEIPFYFKKQGY